MKLKQVFTENGLIGLCFVPLCIIFGHDYNVGRRCIRCFEPKKRE